MNFGEYVHVYNVRGATNTNQPRTVGAIALHPSNNLQGGWYFMSLDTGRRIHRRQWTKLPVSSDVIKRVDELADKENQSLVSTNFKYSWDKGDHDVIADENEEVDISDNGSVSVVEDNVDFDAIALQDVTGEGSDVIDVHHDDENDSEDVVDNELVSIPNEQGEESGSYDATNDHIDEVTSDESTSERDDEESNDDVPDGDVDIPGEPKQVSIVRPSTRSGLRSGSRVNYASLHKFGDKQLSQVHKNIMDKVHKNGSLRGKSPEKKKQVKLMVKDMMRRVVSIIMSQISKESKFAQVSVKEGIKRFGESAINAVLAEFGQLNDQKIFDPKFAHELSGKQKREALNLITLVKEKRCGKIKGRACADGRKQRRYIRKEDVASPTIQLESLLLSLMIDAFEKRDVATADVVGAYLIANMEDFVLVKLTGDSVDLMCKVDESYKKYIHYENGKKVLYLRLLKALYGCMQSALLWYKTFMTRLVDMGFTLNKYDPCVANKVVNGNQCTICWYVDDAKISHKDPSVVDNIIVMLEDVFGKMTVTRGASHTFVGMDICLRKDGSLSIMMKGYLQEAVEAFNEDINTLARTPAKGTLFNEDTDEYEELLSEDKAERFHHIVAKLLYVSKRARIDIDLAISFLCTRVASPTKGDWAKLRRVLQYLKGTMDMPRIIGADNMGLLQSWADASFAVHRDMKGHMGACMSMGRGVVHHRSAKQRLNTRSSTESELVAASDYICWTVWAKRFLSEQGYELDRNVFYQDNTSAMKLAMNGKSSSSGRTRHVHIRYFFTKDTLKREDIEMVHCPTEEMIADYYTKPLQGKQFMKLRSVIMGHETLPMEERVGNKSIGYVMPTGDLNFKHNGKDKARNDHAYVEMKSESMEKTEVEHSKIVRAKTVLDSAGDMVGKIQERATYADIVLKGKKGKR